MSRGLALNLLASALTILATFAFLVAATMGGGSPLAAPASADTRPIIYAFYDAINAVLRTGDPTALDAIVAPHFTMHGGFVAVSPDRAGLARQIVATSAVSPDLQLEVEDLAVADDRALVHLVQTSGSGGAFLGVPFATTPTFWGRFDALRIDSGQVVELWSGEEPVPLFESLGQSRLDPLLNPNHAMMFRQLRDDSGGAWTWTSTFQSRVIYLEAGALTVEVAPASPAPAILFASGGDGQERPVRPGEHGRLRPGEMLALSPVARYRLLGDPSQPALRAYEVAFPRFAYMGPSGPGLANSTAVGTPSPTTLPMRHLLAEAAQTGLPDDALSASFGRITLPPGEPLALGAAPGPMVLSMESGTLAIDQSQADPTTGATTLVPGAATIIPVGEVITLQPVGTEPVVVFVATIVPAHAGTRVMPSSHAMHPGT
jgi:SnoaL-like polyketide cyclase